MLPLVRATLKLLHRKAGPVLPARLLSLRYPNVPGRVHIDDLMLRCEQDTQWYVDGGHCAIQNIKESLAVVGRSFADIESCLDLPCGYGRVTRHLVREMVPDAITASDADTQAVRFCAAEFGVKPLRCDRNPERLSFPQAYEFIFVGSLLTHLPPESGLTLLRSLAGALAPSGVLVATTQGDSCLRNLEWYGPDFVDAAETFRAGLAAAGAAFVPYRAKRLASRQSPTHGTYGIALHTKDYVLKALQDLRLKPIRFQERGMEDHQDIWAACRS